MATRKKWFTEITGEQRIRHASERAVYDYVRKVADERRQGGLSVYVDEGTRTRNVPVLHEEINLAEW